MHAPSATFAAILQSVVYLFDIANPTDNAIDLPGLNLASDVWGAVINAGVQIITNPAVQQAATNLLVAGMNGVAAAINTWAASSGK